METKSSVIGFGIAAADARRLEFRYDYQHRRVQKIVYAGWNGTGYATTLSTNRYLYDGWNLVAEYAVSSGTLALVRSYTWGLDIATDMTKAGGVGALLQIADHASGKTYLPGYDGNGNVVALFNASTGAVAAAYEYSPFGEFLRCESPDPVVADQPFRFSTKFYDGETSLYYYGMRHYSPGQGQFLGRDPIEEKGGRHLYAFCLNNPIMIWDYLGMNPAEEFMREVDGSAGGVLSEDAKIAARIAAAKQSAQDRVMVGPEDIDPNSIEGLAKRLQGYIEGLDPNDARLGFLTTQRDILAAIAYTRDQQGWNSDDRKWIHGIVKDFMDPLFDALEGKGNQRWQTTFDEVASLTRQNALLRSSLGSPLLDDHQAATIRESIRLNDGLAGAKMANTHINQDLRQALINNGVGTDANWAIIGGIVRDASVGTYGEVPVLVSQIVGQIPGFGWTYPGQIRDNMRDALKPDVPIYRRPGG